MNRKKEQGYTIAILKCLYDSGTARSEDLSKKIGISDKTIRKRIPLINDYLQDHGMGSVDIRPHVGIVLTQNTRQRKMLASYLKSNNSSDLNNDTTRMIQALRLLLRSAKSEHAITAQEIAHTLYLSVPTTQKVIQDCENWLKGFGIQLHSIRKRGIVLDYREEDFRHALKEFIVSISETKDAKEDLRYFLPGIHIDAIEKILLEVEKEWKFNFTDHSYIDILVYISISLYESLQGQHLLSGRYNDSLKDIEHSTEYNFCRALYAQENDHLGLSEQPEEIVFLTIQILCSRVIERQTGSSPQKMLEEYDEKLKEFVRRTVSVVSEVMNVDLSKDENLYNGLMNHIRPLLFRIRYGMNSEATANVYVREKYITTLRVSWLVSTLFEEYFHMSVSDNELSYIALYIQSALDRNTRPIRTILVSDLNMSILQMVVDKLQHHVRDIADCRIYTVHEFAQLSHADADLILTTAELDTKDFRILMLPDPFADSNYDLIRERIEAIRKKHSQKPFRFDPITHSLFEPELIMPRVHFANRKELLKEMCKKLTDRGYAAPKYYETVLEREAASQTAIGLGVAIPHGQMKYTNESKLVIATLDEPINWGGEEVKVIFLLNILMDSEDEIAKWQEFYRQFIQLTGSVENVERLCHFKDQIDLYYYFVQ